MIPVRLMLATFLLVALSYVALSFALFEMPATETAAADCGFLPGEFVSAGELTFGRTEAFAVSFVRKQEYLTAASLGLAGAFLAFALTAGRRGGAASAGAAAGGGLMALGAVCVGCLAPALSVVGLGVLGSLFAGVPKALLFLNTLALTGWGTLYLSRRLATCSPAASRA
ncbi:hypothetical protein [Amaricoccus solimangrovi]|uniref:Uncharacterized protein n=1 Tax=Amaricoccus solimangrovi TaxID=2589815 RepID=A0A501WG40_9RHOB|nr:hypothetical protein [Amaricoccus solimangrovi]TPE47330.1 hypothetical protein FJM51_20340 [Amaricoccus solimangrovi]